ncbi:MAG: SdiA-regulated domain-containing protein [Chitinophagaceae bacterium]
MKKLSKYSFVFLLAGVYFLSACKEKKEINNKERMSKTGLVEKPGYNFSQVEKRDMKKKLQEISGIHYVKDDLFVAIDDEDGIIFTVDFATGKIVQEHEFASNGDYEDITMDADFYYVLTSKGSIYKVSREASTAKSSVYNFDVDIGSEFESLYLDSSGENLLLICKSCRQIKNNTINVYSFNLKNLRFSKSPAYSIDLGTLHKGNKRLELKPSAAAIHPIEQKLYVLCSIGNTLLICDLQGNIENSFLLNVDLFPQPEGIAFTPNGDMFISNESKKNANILKLAYRSL